MASAIRNFSPFYSRDDLTHGPVPEEVSSEPISLSSSSTSTAGAEMPAVIGPERKDVHLNQLQTRISPNRGFDHDSSLYGFKCCSSPSQQRVHWPRHGEAPLDTIVTSEATAVLLSTSVWHGG